MSEKDVIIGNLTTIIMFVLSALGGGAIIEALGGTSQTAIVIGALLGLGYSILNAYFPNQFKFLNNHRKEINDISECVCNQTDSEYESDDLIDEEN